MTTEPEQPGAPAGRKFDDIASLFGSIVPPPDTPVRPTPRLLPLPTALPEQPQGPSVVPEPPARPEPVIDDLIAFQRNPSPPPPPSPPPVVRPAAPAPAQFVEPPVIARPRPTEIPWPDAFEPRPNFRKREPRNWSWLLLIPLGNVVAVGIGSIDPRALREWVGVKILHRTPAPASTDGPLLPAPFRSGATTPDPTSAAEPDPTPGATAAASNPFPAIPTSPVPVPAGTEVSPPPIDPAQAAAAAAAPIHVTIQYRRNVPGADGEARRIAALLQGTGGSVELRPAASTVKVPTITYFNAADRPAASALALALANEATSWTLNLGTGKNPPGSLDIAMP